MSSPHEALMMAQRGRPTPFATQAMNVLDWYWIINNSETEVYQSANNVLVPPDDTNYATWQETHGVATPIMTQADLSKVLAQRGTQIPAWLLSLPNFIQPSPGAYDIPQLKGYSGWARYNKSVGGIVVNGIQFPTDTLTLSALNSAMLYTTDKQINTFSWKLPDGTFITLDTLGIKNLQSTVASFGQSCFLADDNNCTAIDAGTMTDLAAIDAVYAAISNQFSSVTGFARRT